MSLNRVKQKLGRRKGEGTAVVGNMSAVDDAQECLILTLALIEQMVEDKIKCYSLNHSEKTSDNRRGGCCYSTTIVMWYIKRVGALGINK